MVRGTKRAINAVALAKIIKVTPGKKLYNAHNRYDNTKLGLNA